MKTQDSNIEKKSTQTVKTNDTENNLYAKQHNYIAHNFQQLLNATGMRKKDLAKQLDVSPASLSGWMDLSGTTISIPSTPVLTQLSELYNISIDDFVTKDLHLYDHGSFSKVEPANVQKYQWYIGTYYCYYFDTSAYKGRDNKPDHQALCYGLMHIYEVVSPISGSDFKVIAIFGLKSVDKMLEIAEYLHNFDCPDEINQLLDDYERIQMGVHHLPISHFSRYFGDLTLTGQHIFINLHYKDKDSASLIFNKPFGHKPAYYGGLGTINSVSRGADSYPCIQYMGLSRAPLNASPEEICYNLLLSIPRIKAPDETEQIIALCKSLVEHQLRQNEDTGYYTISESQLYLTVKAQLEAKLSKVVERNLSRCLRISRRDDDEWYHFIKPDVEAAWMNIQGGEHNEE